MRKKLTITVDEEAYDGLWQVVGAGKISQFIERLVRPHVLPQELDAAYARMAQDTSREAEAELWAEGLLTDVGDKP